MDGVLIRGDGVAAACCAHLLGYAGFRVAVERLRRPKVPAILLSDSAMRLIEDVLGRNDLFSNLPRIERRVVAWGPNADPVAFPHSAAVISEEALLDRIQVVFGSDVLTECADPEWTIYAAQPLPEPAEERFGSRVASAIPVMFKDRQVPATSWIESVTNGWLFAIPNAANAGWLLAVGGPVESLLGASRLITKHILSYGDAGGHFPAYPRIATPLCEPGSRAAVPAWLSIRSVETARRTRSGKPFLLPQSSVLPSKAYPLNAYSPTISCVSWPDCRVILRSAPSFTSPAVTDTGGIRNWLPCVEESDGVTINWLARGNFNTA